MTQAPFQSHFLTSLGPKKPGQVSFFIGKGSTNFPVGSAAPKIFSYSQKDLLITPSSLEWTLWAQFRKSSASQDFIVPLPRSRPMTHGGHATPYRNCTGF
jgi:hypothetical protein